MSVLRKLYRLMRVISAFGYEIAWLLVMRPRTRPERAAWLTRLTRRVMRAVGATWSVEGAAPPAGAVISNHLPFLDIFLHAAAHPCVFVSKAELRGQPILGWISAMAGTVYVERGSGGSAAKAAEGMGKGFRDGLPVVFFPEGTTGTDDTTVMEFRSGLLAQAIVLGQPVYASHVRYTFAQQDLDRGLSPAKHFYWGAQTLPQLLWEFLGLHAVHGYVRFAAEPIAFSAAAVANRKVAGVEAREAVLRLATVDRTKA